MPVKGVRAWNRTFVRIQKSLKKGFFVLSLFLYGMTGWLQAKEIPLKPLPVSRDSVKAPVNIEKPYPELPGNLVLKNENTAKPDIRFIPLSGQIKTARSGMETNRFSILARTANGGYIDDRWVRDATSWSCLPGCVDSNDEGSVSIATGETVDGQFPILWAVTDFMDTSLSPAARSILISYSTDGGSTWNWFGKIHSLSSLNLTNPDIAVDVGANPDRLYITFELERSASDHDACFAAWDVDGQNFVSVCTGFSVHETNPRIAVERNQSPNYAIATYEYHSGNRRWIVVFRSTDGGFSWSGVFVDNVRNADPAPDVTCGVNSAGSSICHLTYINPRGNKNDRLFYSWAPRGNPSDFVSNTRWILTVGNNELVGSVPAIMATNGGGRVMIAVDWVDTAGGGDRDILLAFSEDDGQTFSSGYLDLTDEQYYPALASENYARVTPDNARNIFWLTYWTGTSSPGHVQMMTLASPYSGGILDTPDSYVDDDGLVPLQIHAQAVTDVQNFYGGVTFMRQGTNVDQYYGTKGDLYTFDARLKGTTIHIDVPLTIDGTSYTTPAGPFNWPAFGVHTVSAPDASDDATWHYNFDSWSDGGAQTHDIVAEYARISQPPPETERYAYYDRCNPTPPEVGTMICTKGAGGAVQCSWAPLSSDDADDYRVLRSTAKAPFSSFTEIMRTGGVANSQFIDSTATGSSIYFYLVQAVCGSGNHDHFGPTGYNGP